MMSGAVVSESEAKMPPEWNHRTPRPKIAGQSIVRPDAVVAGTAIALLVAASLGAVGVFWAGCRRGPSSSAFPVEQAGPRGDSSGNS